MVLQYINYVSQSKSSIVCFIINVWGVYLYAQTEDNDSDSDGISNGLSFGGGGAATGSSNTQTNPTSASTTHRTGLLGPFGNSNTQTNQTTTRAPFSFTNSTRASSRASGPSVRDAINAINQMEALGKLEDLFI